MMKIPATIAKACRIGLDDHLRDAEIEWIIANKNRYEGERHIGSIIKNIKYRYQLKSLSL